MSCLRMNIGKIQTVMNIRIKHWIDSNGGEYFWGAKMTKFLEIVPKIKPVADRDSTLKSVWFTFCEALLKKKILPSNATCRVICTC